MSKAVFFDRDGTLIEDAHYLADPAKVVLLPRVAEAVQRLRDAGYLLFVLTNQSGIGRGYFTRATVERCNQRMIELLGLGSSVFAGIGIAPETPAQPVVYRKPSPRFIDECVESHRLERAQSWMVGDKPTDVETGLNARVNAALIDASGDSDAVPTSVPRYRSLYDFALAVAGAGGR